MSANEVSRTELLGLLYREHHAWLLGWLRMRIGCRYLAEDHAHDAFVRFMTVPDVRAVREPRAYLTTLLEIDALLDRLPNRVRSAFLMARLEGLCYAEIGSRLGVSERMVKKYMAQAMLHCLTVSN